MRVLLFPLLTLISFVHCVAQENWESYPADYNGKPGFVLVNMALNKDTSEKAKLPFLLKTVYALSGCNPQGVPYPDSIKKAEEVLDAGTAFVNALISNKASGTFTFDCKRSNYYFVSDTNGLRQSVLEKFRRYYPASPVSVEIKLDKEWQSYFDFLYPTEENQLYMDNMKVIIQLMQSDDPLEVPRAVDLFNYFSDKQKRDAFASQMQKEGYTYVKPTDEKTGDTQFVARLVIMSPATADRIYEITSFVNRKAKEFGGDYDGWEAYLVRKRR